ncbi:MAG: F420-0:Gamma-glutamyl ligase [Leptolyngbyaceae cyanobacterium SM1_1_3]|nr:F420-0:Gamma-glutamyl ligase [Leptolyngbyaceae cyanobacterium SM1_1_3]NJM84844.1 F420-0:Gamma-glutamyl ligase [Leptolyngbyaceae cyanobacterium RM2_2_21]NJN03479.1 F420-0:Gamma-glutamyl ligase [Leptolyngbyaceae cyanobacterium RM1_1_2]NJO09496.1 F420-0:Gamma-glutamyl ligase [Leptolyngbyaceae cyanobacterium SL_1_1]
MALLVSVIVIIAVGAVAAAIAIESQYRQRPGNALTFAAGQWNLETYSANHYVIVGEPQLINQTRSLEIMVPEVKVEATLLSGNSLDQVKIQTRLMPQHPDAPARADDYWFAYIVKVGKTTQMEITVDIQGPDLNQLKVLWLRVRYITYGPQGRIPKTGHVVVPLRFPNPEAIPAWRSTEIAERLPVATHLLTHLDDPVAVVKRYVMPHAKPGDIITLGETPVAIMQGRWRHPETVKPGWVARRLCYYFMPTSSLATACGMQTLVDVSGAWRVVYAFIVGAIAKKILGQPGLFYQLAGEQARLIDDVTGTLPPYDQFIVLGPHQPQQVVENILKETGLAAAIVDVNDLKAVKILAATSGVNSALLSQALIDNPAGNADEQTPLVLVRPRAQG